MPKLGRPVQVVAALRLLDLAAELLQLLAQPLQSVNCVPLGLPSRGQRVTLGPQVGQMAAQRLEPVLAGRVGLLLERGLLDLQLHHPARDLVELLRHRVDLGADHGAGLVDQVDRLVGQEPVGDIAVRQRGRRDQRRILDLDPVVHLVALAQPAQYRDRVLDGRLVHHDRLEPALQRRVPLDLAILTERRRADAVQLAASQHWLEHVARVHRALGCAGADHVMQLVDEQQDASLGGLDLLEHRLQALLELTTVLRAGDQRAHVEGEHRPVAQPLRHVPLHDALSEPLDDRRLADARLADQHRVVLLLRERIWIVRRISVSRPITGSSRPARASATRSRPYFSSAS